MAGLLVWLIVIELAFVLFGVLGASSLAMQTRSHFAARVSLSCLAMVALVLLVAGAAMVHVLPRDALGPLWLPLALAALIPGPTFCYRRSAPSSGSSGGDDGGGSDRDQPPRRPTTPPGGIPLPDAHQAFVRARDHNRPILRDGHPRRREREPGRTVAPRRHFS